jgi:hypothetical protein
VTIQKATASQAVKASQISALAIGVSSGRPAASPYAAVATAYMPRGKTMLQSVCS